MYRIFSQLLILSVILSLTGCAQKLPIKPDGSGGVLAIPFKATDEFGRGGFVYYYTLSGTQPIPFEIRIDPAVGKDFIFSKVLPEGIYEVDTWTTLSVPTSSVMTSTHKRAQKLDPPIKFLIKDDTVVVFGHRFEVEKKTTDQESFTVGAHWTGLNETIQKEYSTKLESYDNREQWSVKTINEVIVELQ